MSSDIQNKILNLREKQKEKELTVDGELELVKQAKFNEIELDFYVDESGKMFMTRRQIAEALGYSKNGVHNIIQRNRNNFNGLVGTHRLSTPGGKQETSILNRRGVEEVCRFSTKPKANQFIDFVFSIYNEYQDEGKVDKFDKQIEEAAQTKEEADLMKDIKSLEEMLARDQDNNIIQLELRRKKDRLQDIREKQSLKQEIEEAKEEVAAIKSTFAAIDDDWRDYVNGVFRKIGNKTGDYSSYRKESYIMLDRRAGVNISQRLSNKKQRMKESGATKTAINKVNRLDVIEDDKKLIEIYVNIVKEFEAKYL